MSSPDRVTITVRLSQRPDGDTVAFVAPSPPDYRSSFSGSGLPFAGFKQAFDRTPNKGSAAVDRETNTVSLALYPPNSYYAGLGTVLIQPKVHIRYTSSGKTVEETAPVGASVPFRTLTYPAWNTRPRTGPEFYDTGDLPVRSQEAILRASAYPTRNVMPPNFWGTKPPL